VTVNIKHLKLAILRRQKLRQYRLQIYFSCVWAKRHV